MDMTGMNLASRVFGDALSNMVLQRSIVLPRFALAAARR